jgi:hypothetical protein
MAKVALLECKGSAELQAKSPASLTSVHRTVLAIKIAANRQAQFFLLSRYVVFDSAKRWLTKHELRKLLFRDMIGTDWIQMTPWLCYSTELERIWVACWLFTLFQSLEDSTSGKLTSSLELESRGRPPKRPERPETKKLLLEVNSAT